MKVRFQADSDLNQDIVSGIKRRVPEIGFQTSHEAGLYGMPDEDVLALAAKEKRIVVSHDRSTMPIAFANLVQREISAGWIIISQNVSVSTAIEELILIWAASEAEEYENVILKIPL